MSLEGKIAPSPSRRNRSASRSRTTTTTTTRRRSTATTAPKNKDEAKTTTYPRWHSTVAGATAGAGARLLTAPLDLLKIRRQLAVSTTTATASAPATPGHQSSSNIFDSLRQIYKTEGGLRSLFRGNVAATYLWIGYAAIQFTLYSRTSDLLTSFHRPPHEVVRQPPTSHHNPLSSIVRDMGNTLTGSPTAVAFVSGASAGVCATLVTYPFDICRTTFAAIGLQNAEGMAGTFSRGAGVAAAVEGAKVAAKDAGAGALGGGMKHPPRTVWDFAKTMYRSRGIKGFYAGCGPALIQIVPYMGINFAVYDSLVRWQKGRTNVGNAGVAGVIAGGTSKLLVYPLDTVKKRLQAQAFFASSASLGTGSSVKAASAAMERVTYTGMMDCLTTVLKEEGVGALYKGLVPTVLKSCVGTGCSFAFFQLSKNVLEGLHDGRRKGQEEEEGQR